MIEKIIKEYINRHSRCIATDGEYTDAEMVKILSDAMKRNLEEDVAWLRAKLTPLVAQKEGDLELLAEQQGKTIGEGWKQKEQKEGVECCSKCAMTRHISSGCPCHTPTPTVKEESHTQGFEERFLKWVNEQEKRSEQHGFAYNRYIHEDQVKILAAQEYERGFDAGGHTVGGTGRVMYERGFEAGKLQGREEALREAIAALPLNYSGLCHFDCDQKYCNCNATWNDCREATLAALTSLAAPTEI